jgi:hypothetical protein
MANFEDRQRKEEAQYKHDQELRFKVRNRRNRLFGLWVAEQLGKDAEAAAAYAKSVVLKDFESPGDEDVLGMVRADLAEKGIDISDHMLTKRLAEFEQAAKDQVMSE